MAKEEMQTRKERIEEFKRGDEREIDKEGRDGKIVKIVPDFIFPNSERVADVCFHIRLF